MKPLKAPHALDFETSSERRNCSSAPRKGGKWQTHRVDGKWFKKTSQIAYLMSFQVAKKYSASVRFHINC